ncbi:hypothetical protein EES40_15205 [Streptomyces sp. ADI93-02]|nr:hypothetical protein EES40_15205 [Streptomyces sp. ADI93-02]
MPASTATSPRLTSSAAPKPCSSLRRPYDFSGRTALASSMAGVSVAGGSASTWASSSGVAGIPAAAVSRCSSLRIQSPGVTPRSASNSASSSSWSARSSSGAVGTAGRCPGEVPPSSSGSVSSLR